MVTPQRVFGKYCTIPWTIVKNSRHQTGTCKRKRQEKKHKVQSRRLETLIPNIGMWIAKNVFFTTYKYFYIPKLSFIAVRGRRPEFGRCQTEWRVSPVKDDINVWQLTLSCCLFQSFALLCRASLPNVTWYHLDICVQCHVSRHTIATWCTALPRGTGSNVMRQRDSGRNFTWMSMNYRVSDRLFPDCLAMQNI